MKQEKMQQDTGKFTYNTTRKDNITVESAGDQREDKNRSSLNPKILF